MVYFINSNRRKRENHHYHMLNHASRFDRKGHLNMAQICHLMKLTQTHQNSERNFVKYGGWKNIPDCLQDAGRFRLVLLPSIYLPQSKLEGPHPISGRKSLWEGTEAHQQPHRHENTPDVTTDWESWRSWSSWDYSNAWWDTELFKMLGCLFCQVLPAPRDSVEFEYLRKTEGVFIFRHSWLELVRNPQYVSGAQLLGVMSDIISCSLHFSSLYSGRRALQIMPPP